jgi:hypothetical protein
MSSILSPGIDGLHETMPLVYVADEAYIDSRK